MLGYDRVRSSKRAVLEIERQLVLRYGDLTAYLETNDLGGIGRIEHKVDGISEQQTVILEAIDRVFFDTRTRHKTASLVSDRTDDDKTG